MEKSRKKINELLALADGRTKALIMPHDYADPDAIAAALAMQYLLKKKLKIPSIISSAGVVGREENRVLCSCLEVAITPIHKVDIEEYDFIALVDCQPGTGNNSLPEGIIADAVVDHHPREGRLDRVKFVDIRDDCGSSSTILTEYLRASRLRINKYLATALFYGLKTDVMNVGRQSHPSDVKAFSHLFPLIDEEKLRLIEKAKLPSEYFKKLKDAIEDAGTYDDILVSDLGDVGNPGMVGELADLFLRLNGVTTALCFGSYDSKLLISIRTSTPAIDAGKIIRFAVGERGTAGGHSTMAGGQISLLKETKKEQKEHIKAVLGKIFQRLGIAGKRKNKVI